MKKEDVMTPVYYEILPVTLVANHAVLLRRREDRHASSWLVPHQPGLHPNSAIVQHLAAFFGDKFEPRASIVHSTSWRSSNQGEQLIITYLVALPQRCWMYDWAAAGRIFMQQVGPVEQVHGDNLHAPENIEVDNVLAHALDHLALLYSYDADIQAVLEPAWLDLLQQRLPKPAGYFSPEPIIIRMLTA
jgi:hypothetical protein